jgi:uncharacterized protein (UPF0276 family)
MNQNTKIALTVSQHFHEIYPVLAELIDAIVFRDVNNILSIKDVDRMFHLNGFINTDFDETVTPDFLKRLQFHNIDFISFDLGPSCKKIRMEDFYVADDPVLAPEEILIIGKRKIDKIRSIYSGAISLENMDYHKGGAYEYVCEPHFIKNAVEEFDVDFTLDIGHLNVTCFYNGMKPEDYIMALPMDRLKEVHISHAIDDDDTHGIPTTSDYDLLKYIFSINQPEYTVLEYYWDPDVIVKETKRLYEFLGNMTHSVVN